MTTQTVIFESAILPTTVKLVPWGGGTAVTASAIAAASGNRDGYFSATFSGLTGKYSLHAYDAGGETIVTDTITMKNVASEQFVWGLYGANVQGWQDTLVPAPDTAGYPVSTIKQGTGAGELLITLGIVQADVEQLLGNANLATFLGNLVKNQLNVTGNNHTSFTTSAFSVTATGLTASKIPPGTRLRIGTIGSDTANAGVFTTVVTSTDSATNIVDLTVQPSLPAAPTASTVFTVVDNDEQTAAAMTELLALLAGTDGFTLIELIKIGIAVLCGEASGATLSGGTVVYKSLDGTINRISAQVDPFGNRLSVTPNVS